MMHAQLKMFSSFFFYIYIRVLHVVNISEPQWGLYWLSSMSFWWICCEVGKQAELNLSADLSLYVTGELQVIYDGGENNAECKW